MSVSSLSGRRSESDPRAEMQPGQTAGLQSRTLCLLAQIRLSHRLHAVDQPSHSPFEVLGHDALDPQCAPDSSTTDRRGEAIRPPMQVCPPTQLALPYVSDQPCRRPHQTQQFGLVSLLSAAQTGTDRPAHMLSLAIASDQVPLPGSAIVRCCSAFSASGRTLPAASMVLVLMEPATTVRSPSMRASKPCFATCAGSSLEP